MELFLSLRDPSVYCEIKDPPIMLLLLLLLCVCVRKQLLDRFRYWKVVSAREEGTPWLASAFCEEIYTSKNNLSVLLIFYPCFGKRRWKCDARHAIGWCKHKRAKQKNLFSSEAHMSSDGEHFSNESQDVRLAPKSGVKKSPFSSLFWSAKGQYD